jgi:hypothetical protein
MIWIKHAFLFKRQTMLFQKMNHQFWDLSRIFGVRDRLRCPACRAVGTWKPHGGWLDDKPHIRRWMCKWCGHYDGLEGEPIGGSVVVYSIVDGCWMQKYLRPEGKTPKAVIGTDPSMISKREGAEQITCNPWRG